MSIIEEGILFTDAEFFNDNAEHMYDCVCHDGYAEGVLAEDSDAPKTIRIEYPLMKDVVQDDDLVLDILRYRGLYDLGPKDIHYGDIMVMLGKIEK